MKTEMKAVVASIVVIALALTAVSGVTYSWFSDTEKATIDISTATIDIEGNFIDGSLKVVNAKGNSITIEDGSTYAGFYADKKGITISDLEPNKIITANYELTNKSSVNTIYRMYAIVEGVDDLNGLKISIKCTEGGMTVPSEELSFNNGVAYIIGGAEGTTMTKSSGNGTVYKFTVTIDSNEFTGAMSENFSIKFVNEAYQSDYTYTPVTVMNSTGTATITVPTGDEGVTVVGTAPKDESSTASPADVRVEFSAGALKTAAGSAESVNFEAKMSGTTDAPILSLGLTGGSSTTDFGTDKVTVTVTVPGTNANLTVVYLGTGESQPTDITKKTVGSNTEITFSTTHFSDFMVTDSEVVAISDDGKTVQTFNSVSTALTAKDFTASSIIVASDITESSAIVINNAVTIDGRNHTITTNATNGIYIYSSSEAAVTIRNLTLEDTTADNTDSYGINCYGSENKVNNVILTLDNVSVTGYNTKGTYITGAKSVTINGGTYTDNATYQEIVGDRVITGTNAFQGGDHALQIDINKGHSGVTIKIKDVIFKGDNGIISPICISQRAGDKDATTTYIEKATISGCTFDEKSSGMLGNISVGTTPKEADNTKKIGNQAFTLDITASGDTVVVYRGEVKTENTLDCVDKAPLYLTIANGATINATGSVSDKSLTIKISEGVTASGNIKTGESVVDKENNKVTLANYKIGDLATPYATLSDAITAATSGQTITVLSNVYEGSSVSIDKDLILDLNNKTLDIRSMTVGFHGTETVVNETEDQKSNLTIKNGNLNTNTVGTSSAICVGVGSKLTLDTVTFDARDGSAIWTRGSASYLIVTNSTINAGVYGVGTNSAIEANYGVNITITNSTIDVSKTDNNDNTAVMINVAGNLKIENSTLIADRQCLVVRAGEATVSGENNVFKFTNKFATDPPAKADQREGTWDNGNEVSTAAIVVGDTAVGSYNANAILKLTNVIVKAPENAKTLVVSQERGVNAKYTTSITLDENNTDVLKSVWYHVSDENGSSWSLVNASDAVSSGTTSITTTTDGKFTPSATA